MIEVNFYDEVDDSLLEFAVIISKSNLKNTQQYTQSTPP